LDRLGAGHKTGPTFAIHQAGMKAYNLCPNLLIMTIVNKVSALIPLCCELFAATAMFIVAA
jgi:hypothetical protein